MKIKNYQKNKGLVTQKAGFTLIELMVATSIFAIIMVVAIGAVIVTLNSAKESRALHLAMDNVNFAMESMTRSIRMGTNYYCGDVSMLDLTNTQDCSSGSLISFVPQSQGGIKSISRVAYQKEGNTIMRYSDSSSDGVPIVSPDVVINTLKFFVKGSNLEIGGVNNTQPSVYIIMKGTISVNGKNNSFSLQTMASQINLSNLSSL